MFTAVFGCCKTAHAQQVGSYGRLGWTGFFLALTATTLLLAQILLAQLWLLDSGLASGPFWELPSWLFIYGYLLLGIATIEAKALPRWCGFAIIIAMLAPAS